MAPSSELVRFELDRGIARVTLNRADARNALSLGLIEALAGAIEQTSREGSARAMVLRGEGIAFCAGMDLKGVATDPTAMGDMLRTLSRVMRAIRRLPIPTISQVRGAAIGGGCGLMVVTDFAFTHAEAKLGYPEVDLGVCPAVVAPWLIRKIGAGPARAMLLAGGTISGTEAFELGLATHLVPLENLTTLVTEFALRLTKGGAKALATTKRLLNELDGSDDDAVAERAAALSAQIIQGEEAQSRIRKLFAEKKSA